jgi:hypothetical protein
VATKVAVDQFGSDHLAALWWLTWSSSFFFSFYFVEIFSFFVFQKTFQNITELSCGLHVQHFFQMWPQPN